MMMRVIVAPMTVAVMTNAVSAMVPIMQPPVLMEAVLGWTAQVRVVVVQFINHIMLIQMEMA